MTWFPFPQSVLVFAQEGYDRYGDYQYATTGRLVKGCATAPRSSREEADRRDTIIVGLTLYAPADAAITATDQIEIVGSPIRWHVEGEPGLWRNPFTGWDAGLEVALTRVSG